MFIFQQILNMFRASLCPSSGEQDVCCCMWCAALVLLDVVGSAPQPLPTTSSRTSAAHHMQQHTSWSPEDEHNDARNMLRNC